MFSNNVQKHFKLSTPTVQQQWHLCYLFKMVIEKTLMLFSRILSDTVMAGPNFLKDKTAITSVT